MSKKLSDSAFDMLAQRKADQKSDPGLAHETKGGMLAGSNKIKLVLGVLAVVGLLVLAKIVLGLVAGLLGILIAVVTFPFVHWVWTLIAIAAFIAYKATRSK